LERFIEHILAFITSFASTGIETLPVGYALGAGMLATVNPCGFALLPAYISFHLGDASEGTHKNTTTMRLFKGL
jgi:cytochrome c biogenesis protein CcdA